MVGILALGGCAGSRIPEGEPADAVCSAQQKKGEATLRKVRGYLSSYSAVILDNDCTYKYDELNKGEFEQMVAALKTGRLASYRPRRVEPGGGSGDISLRVDALHDLPLDDIWSETREAEEIRREAETGIGPEPPALVLPDAEYEKLISLPPVAKLRRIAQELAPQKPYRAVLKSAAKELKAQHPDRVYLKIPKGLGASPRERLDAFLKLYELGADINETRDEYDYTGLGYACMLGDRDTLHRLVNMGANLRDGILHNALHDECGCTLTDTSNFMPGYVAIAIEHGQQDIARWLLQHKAPASGVHACVEQDDVQMLRELIAAGAKPHKDEAGVINHAKSDEMRLLLRRYGWGKGKK